MNVRFSLAISLLALSVACSSSPSSPSMPSPTPSSGSGTSVTIVSGAAALSTTAYAPNPITVAVGSTLTWVNNDSIAHTSTANGGAWNSGTMAPGASFSTILSSAGTYQYHCSIHPGMVGTVTVQ
jgi:plastocyanin